jgi:uncharacterized protein YndB with AHSA1/START domain
MLGNRPSHPEADLSAMIAEVSVPFAVPIHAVWDLLTDLSRMVRWSPEVRSIRWLDEQGCVPGAQFRARNRRGLFSWRVTGEIVLAEAPTRLEWVIGDPACPSSRWSYTLRDEHGRTTVTQRFQHGPGPSWIRYAVEREPAAAALLIEQRRHMLLRDMQATLRQAAAALIEPA